MFALLKRSIKAMLRPFVRPFLERIRLMVREEVAPLRAEIAATKDVPSSPPTGNDETLDDFEAYASKLDSIYLEFTNHCAYKCRMCKHSSMRRKKGFIGIDDLEWVCRNIAENRNDFYGIITLSGFGEALLDGDFATKGRLVRRYFPNARIGINTTLGSMHPSMTLETLADSGLTYMNVSFRGATRETYLEAHGVDSYDAVFAKLPLLAELHHKSVLSVLIRGPFTNAGPARHTGAETGKLPEECTRLNLPYSTDDMHNWGGHFHHAGPGKAPTLPCSVYKGCFSRILNVSWDLTVTPCCITAADEEIVLGSLKNRTLRELFYGREWQDFREAHKTMTTKEKYPFCHICNAADEWVPKRRP